MNKKVIIIGAGGHGNVIADIVIANNDQVFGFLDDDSSKNVLGSIEDYKKYNDYYFVIGIGNPKIRRNISDKMNGVKWYTAIHPSAIISPFATIEEGTVVMPNVVINTKTHIRKHCIINTGAIIEHNNTIDEYAHVSVGTKLGGNVSIGKNTWIGIGAIICNNIKICDNCFIGAGAVVVENITQPGTYVGMPAKKAKRDNNL